MLFGSTVLEVAIGIIFVYLLLSLLCSAVNEYIEAKLNYRARNLWKGVQLLLNGHVDDARRKPVIGVPGAAAREPAIESPPAEPVIESPPGEPGEIDLASALYNHGLVRALFRDAESLPSYIPSRTFALALWNLAGGSTGGDTTDLAKIKEVINRNVPNKHLRESLVTLIDEARGDFDRARKNIEDWFDGAMDRVSGWYKRRTQVILLVIGFVVAMLINADTINIGRALVNDDSLRRSVVASAERTAAQPLPSPAPTPATPEERERVARQKIGDARAQLDELGLPLGWEHNRYDAGGRLANADSLRRLPADASEFILKLFGLLLTGLAISQGAPFWFDLLNKFMVIRSTVKPKEKSPDEGSKD